MIYSHRQFGFAVVTLGTMFAASGAFAQQPLPAPVVLASQPIAIEVNQIMTTDSIKGKDSLLFKHVGFRPTTGAVKTEAAPTISHSRKLEEVEAPSSL